MYNNMSTCGQVNIKLIKKGEKILMELPENRALFSIKEMCEICGISRASLLRLEEDGFLLPYRVNPDTGYRYYDMQNVTAVGQYQRM